MGRPGRIAGLVLAAFTLLGAAACGSQSGGIEQTAIGDAAGLDRAAFVDRPAVEVPSSDGWGPFLDPDAEPRTDLGRLRARHLPVWTSDLDWAFPPETCGTAWELDGIAESTLAFDTEVLGDFATAAALSVMRYEHQLSRALADPDPLAQLCVATASVGPARSDAMDILASYLATGARRAEPAGYPDEVWILAVSPSSALSVACVTPGYPAVVRADGETIESAQSPARLQTYLLSVSRGLEDQVADISYRVSNASHRTAQDCSELDDWAAEWDQQIQDWVAEGQLWEPFGEVLTADGICESPPPDGPDECPRSWPQ